jgi:outer membrane lipopolysaccharide assembly protein LptE/RlpB
MLIAMTAIVLSTASCGYSLSGSGAMHDGAGGAYNSISIPIFTNDTFEPLIEYELTSALKTEVAYNGRWAVTDSPGAGLKVAGRVAGFELLPLSYDISERIQEYRLKILMDVSVTDTATGKVVWREAGMEAFADYRVTEDITKSKINKSEAIKKASKNFSEEFVIKVLDIL